MLVILGMVGFAKAVKGTGMENRNGGAVTALSRGDKGFYAISKGGGKVSEKVYTGLPSGDYCNVIQGCPTTSGCEGDVAHVDASGYVQVNINDSENPMFAIHVGMSVVPTILF